MSTIESYIFNVAGYREVTSDTVDAKMADLAKRLSISPAPEASETQTPNRSHFDLNRLFYESACRSLTLLAGLRVARRFRAALTRVVQKALAPAFLSRFRTSASVTPSGIDTMYNAQNNPPSDAKVGVDFVVIHFLR